MKKERRSINIDNDSIKWIEEQINKGEFDSRSSAVRKCISIARMNKNDRKKYEI